MRDDIHALNHALEERHWWFRGRRRVMRAVVDAALPAAGGGDGGRAAIDVGCGSGANVAALPDRFFRVGIDPEPRAIELARTRHPAVEFRCGSAPDDVADLLPRADLVLLTDVLEHVPDDFRFLSALLAPLPAGAHLLVTVPADPRLWSPHDVAHHHYRRYERARFARVWAGLPVNVRLLSHFNTRLAPLVRAVRAAGNRLGAGHGDDAGRGDLRLPPAPANRVLEAVFAGEAARLVRAIDRPDARDRRGVSLIALLRREPGDCPVRTRPVDVPPDPHDPHG